MCREIRSTARGCCFTNVYVHYRCLRWDLTWFLYWTETKIIYYSCLFYGKIIMGLQYTKLKLWKAKTCSICRTVSLETVETVRTESVVGQVSEPMATASQIKFAVPSFDPLTKQMAVPLKEVLSATGPLANQKLSHICSQLNVYLVKKKCKTREKQQKKDVLGFWS